MKNKIKIIVIILIGIIYILPIGVYAQDLTSEESSVETVPEYIRNLYISGLILVGIVAMGRLIYAGYLYMFGGINANTTGAAKEAITDVISGITLLLCAFLLIRTINPKILNFTWTAFKIDASHVIDVLRKECEENGGSFKKETGDCIFTHMKTQNYEACKAICKSQGKEVEKYEKNGDCFCEGDEVIGKKCTNISDCNDSGKTDYLCQGGTCISNPHNINNGEFGEECGFGNPFDWDSQCNNKYTCGQPDSNGKRYCTINKWEVYCANDSDCPKDEGYTTCSSQNICVP